MFDFSISKVNVYVKLFVEYATVASFILFIVDCKSDIYFLLVLYFCLISSVDPDTQSLGFM
jgi:hypothetical protein